MTTPAAMAAAAAPVLAPVLAPVRNPPRPRDGWADRRGDRRGDGRGSGRHPRNIGPMRACRRCGARTRAGLPCRSPAVRGRARCRMHGGAKRSGAQAGNRNRLRHGFWSRASVEARMRFRAVILGMEDWMAEEEDGDGASGPPRARAGPSAAGQP